LAAHAPGRRIVVAMGRSEIAGRPPVGPAIERAARLLGDRAPDPPGAARELVTLDEVAVGLLDGRFDVRDESGVFVLRGERDVAEARTLLGKPTPCVGRERELRMLEGLLAGCVEDHEAQAVLVTAPPGVGKSRLAHEFLRPLRERAGAIAVWMARGDSL